MTTESSKNPLETGASKARVTNSETVNPFVTSSKKSNTELSVKETNLKDFLSLKELKLVLFIQSSKERVTIKIIEEKLGKEYTGAIGRLIGNGLVESLKHREQYNPLCPTRMTKYYAIKGEQNL